MQELLTNILEFNFFHSFKYIISCFFIVIFTLAVNQTESIEKAKCQSQFSTYSQHCAGDMDLRSSVTEKFYYQ